LLAVHAEPLILLMILAEGEGPSTLRHDDMMA
jgi:hypothetical protein